MKSLFIGCPSWYTGSKESEVIRMVGFLLTHPLALIALTAGYVLLVIEMCIPGFGVPGITGSVLAVLGLFAMQPTPLQALTMMIVYVLLLMIALVIVLRSVARGRLSKSRLVLNEVATRSDGGDPEQYIGKTGAAHTPLRPAGIADLNGVRLNVVTEGDFIERGTPVRVARVSGNRVVVAADQ